MPSGIHHVTSIASSARRNLDFYTRTLGLRLVKKTVNFDDPGSYHLYYGDAAGHPGTILTFFAWEGAAPGRLGVGETQETVFSIPEGSIGYWTQRLIEKGVAHDPPAKRFGATTIAFKDQDGTRLALAGVKGVEAKPGWSAGDVPAEHSIRGFHSVSLLLAEAGPTAAILTDVFGFVATGSEGPTQRFQAPGVEMGGAIDLRTAGEFLSARQGAGSVHHLAFRATDDRSRRRWFASWPKIIACEPPSRRTATTFARSISASPAACCSKSPLTRPASPSTNRPIRLGKH